MVWEMASPAFEGRYRAMVSVHDDGSVCTSTGSTRMTPNSAEMAPALRRRGFRCRGRKVENGQVEPGAATAGARPGRPGGLEALADRIAWPTKKAAKHDTRPTTSETPVNTVALAARTVRRCGTAASVDRMAPVLFHR